MKNFICLSILIFSIRSCFSLLNNSPNESYENNKCPKLYPKKFYSFAPVGNLTAANYYEKKELKGLKQCVLGCCLSDTCNVAFIINENCYHLVCVSDELCLPLLRPLSKDNISMILVKPVLPNENWSDILEQSRFRDAKNNFATDDDSAYFTFGHRSDVQPDDDSNMFAQFINNLPSSDDDDDNSRGFEKYRDSDGELMDASTFLEKEPCKVGVSECPYNSECIPLSMKTRNGICKCVPGTEENGEGACVTLRPFSKGPTNMQSLKGGDLDGKSDDRKDNLPSPAVQNLTVSILSKEVQLPENEVTLAAYTIPDEKATGSHYSYVWTLVDQPKGGFTGNMNQNGATVTLTDLTEGQYRFKVAVNGTAAYGEGLANVTVLPPQRTNKPPQVVITPQTQTVKLPNSVAVLDGSGSKDDDAIISWHWELTAGPIGYQPPLAGAPTLVLRDLNKPGSYVFTLTVEDSDHVKNSTTANITVLNHTDYPPEANAGQDVIIYLPRNNLTLNGNMSTDDHEITSWEWTKAAGDENKAVDMQNTHSPYLQLSNLSEGMYTFALKVTDSSAQASTAEVHVFVKPPTNTPPAAAAGRDMFISLPQTWVVLNGSASSDDHRIVAYTWSCEPAGPTIVRYNESVANATGLTKGQYVFTLTVLDDNGNSASDNVTVTVTQNKNSPPKANAGGDQVLSLPVPLLVLNGSQSSDDFRVVSWRWARAAPGLAAGRVVLHSDTSPVLMLTAIEPGRYVFELTVTDDQGESSKDTVSVQVKPDPLENSLLELTLHVPVASFTASQLASLEQKLALLLKDDVRVNVTQVRGELDSGNTQIVFFLWADQHALHGNEALALVTEAGGAGAGYAAGVARLRTVRCLSDCSGRGVCEQATRACRCDAFWMQSLLRGAQPDCDWSVVYASLGGILVLCAALGACALCGRLCAGRRGGGGGAGRGGEQRARPAYRLLPRAEREAQPFSKDMSDTETDSDVLFESQKTTSFTRAANGDLSTKSNMKKNGHFKLRKVKT